MSTGTMLVATPTPSADKGMYITHEYHNLYLCWSFVLYAYVTGFAKMYIVCTCTSI